MQNFRNSTAGAGVRHPWRVWPLIWAVSVLMLLGNCSAWKSGGEDAYSQARAALRAGEYGKARTLFAAAARGKTNLAESRAGLLQTMRETGAYREALEQAEKFAAGGESDVVHLEYGRLLKETGDYANAESRLRKAISLAARNPVVRMDATTELAMLLETLGRRGDAEALWDRVLDEYRAGKVSGSGPLGNAAVAAWHRDRVQEANDIFMDATDPARGEVSIEALADFGYLFLEKYQATDAIGVFRDCLKINPSYPPALLGIALARKYDNDLEVEAYSRAALKVNPNLVGALNALAVLAIEEENFDGALEHINAALGINPADFETAALQAFCHYIRGNRAEFARIEKRVLEINPACGRFYHILADNLVSRRKYREAVEWSRKAIELDPRLWAAHVTYGMNLMRIGALDEGRKAIQLAFEGDPSNVWAYNTLELFDEMDSFARVQSRNFTLLLPAEDAAALGSYMPELAEEVYAKLTARYGFKPDGPLQIEVFPDHKSFAVRTQGLPGLDGALGVCFGKVIALDSPRGGTAGSYNWGSTLWHEFAHVMTLQMTDYNIPRWFSEGISVYEEYRARPGWGDKLNLPFLQAYKAGKLMKASELNAGFVRPQSPQQIMFAYYQSALVCEMIEEKYGFEKIRQALQLFAQNRQAEEVFRETLGLSPAEMDAEYARFLDARYRTLASRVVSENPARDPSSSQDGEALEARLRSDPDDFWANLRLGMLLLEKRDYPEAELRLKKAQQLFPQYVEPGNPYELLARAYLEQKREGDALAQFVEWSLRDGTAAVPLLKAAEIYRSRKDWAGAVRMLNLSVYINPYDFAIQNSLGEAAMAAGNFPLAIAAYRTLAGMNPPDRAGAHYELARALEAAGKREEAKREVLRALESAPGFRKAQELLLRLAGNQ